MTELQVSTKKHGGGRNLKKFLAMFLAVCVCMTTFQLNAFAESTPEGKNDVTPATALEFQGEKEDVTVGEATKQLCVYEVEQGGTRNLNDDLKKTPADANDLDWTSDNAAAAVVDQNGEVTVPETAEAGATAVITVEGRTQNVEVECMIRVITKSNTGGDNTGGDNTGGDNTGGDNTGGGNTGTTPAPEPTPTPAPTPEPAPTPAPQPEKVAVKKVTLTAKTVYIVKGKKVTVGASVEPANATDKKVTWKSNKTSIATVNSKGVISAKKAGTAKVTATADGKSATVTVKVVSKAKNAKSIKLSKKSLKLKVKDTVALTATLNPSGATSTINWKSSNTKVATVKNGVVTAKAAGTTTITATANKKKATCTITVTTDAKTKLAKTKGTVKVGKTIKLSVNNGDKIKSCTTSNKKVATVTNKGVIKGKKAGKATITVVTGKGAVLTYKVTVKK